jgi:hypothetical protein
MGVTSINNYAKEKKLRKSLIKQSERTVKVLIPDDR